jgi:GNAT superfamily N-acetyltransferase
LPPGCDTVLTVTGADGQPTATGTCEHWAGDAESLDLSWGAARRFQLAPQIAGPDVAGALDDLLSQWRDHLAAVPGTDDEDAAALVMWPSRDIHGIRTLLRHGLAPMEVIAARPTGRHPAGPADAAPRGAEGLAVSASPDAVLAQRGVRIRRAGPADIDAVVRLGVEVIRFDAHFGGVTERPGTAAAMRREVAGLLTGPEPWTWLAERDGTAIGMLAAQRPEAASWIAPMVRPDPVAYLMLMFVLPGERASGVGGALTARLHREVEAAGAVVTLLHYEQANPLSVPFWSQQGYRPLWTTWAARPARAVR